MRPSERAHRADAPSLRYPAVLLPRLEELSAAVMIALRPDEGAARGQFVATLIELETAEINDGGERAPPI